VANFKKQIQNYLNEINIKKIMAFILDDYSIILDKTMRSSMLGLYSAFKELKILGYQKAFALSCDNPLIKYEVINYLINQCKKYDSCIPQWNNGYLEHLFAIYPIKKAFLGAKKCLQKGNLKMINLIDNNWKINYLSIISSFSEDGYVRKTLLIFYVFYPN